jgi:hypothetical protein
MPALRLARRVPPCPSFSWIWTSLVFVRCHDLSVEGLIHDRNTLRRVSCHESRPLPCVVEYHPFVRQPKVMANEIVEAALEASTDVCDRDRCPPRSRGHPPACARPRRRSAGAGCSEAPGQGFPWARDSPQVDVTTALTTCSISSLVGPCRAIRRLTPGRSDRNPCALGGVPGVQRWNPPKELPPWP